MKYVLFYELADGRTRWQSNCAVTSAAWPHSTQPGTLLMASTYGATRGAPGHLHHARGGRGFEPFVVHGVVTYTIQDWARSIGQQKTATEDQNICVMEPARTPRRLTFAATLMLGVATMVALLVGHSQQPERRGTCGCWCGGLRAQRVGRLACICTPALRRWLDAYLPPPRCCCPGPALWLCYATAILDTTKPPAAGPGTAAPPAFCAGADPAR